MLGCLGDVVGALDDLLSEELVVHCGGPGLRRRRLTALHLQPRGTGGQEAEGAVNGVQSRALRRKGRRSKLSMGAGDKQTRGGDGDKQQQRLESYFREERGHLSHSRVDLLRTRNKAEEERTELFTLAANTKPEAKCCSWGCLTKSVYFSETTLCCVFLFSLV